MQLALGALGTVAFCVYSRTWQDLAHMIYDPLAALPVYSFIAQLLLETPRWSTRYWRSRFLMLAAMTLVTVGREFLHWPISGHLSCAATVAIVQGWDGRLPRWERVLYCLPVPFLVALRWWHFDCGRHLPTWMALTFALVAGGWVVSANRRSSKRQKV